MDIGRGIVEKGTGAEMDLLLAILIAIVTVLIINVYLLTRELKRIKEDLQRFSAHVCDDSLQARRLCLDRALDELDGKI